MYNQHNSHGRGGRSKGHQRPKPKQRDELEEADAIVSATLSRGQRSLYNDDDDSSNGWSSDSSGVDSFEESDAELERIIQRRRMLQSRGLISSRFEVESLINNGRKRDVVILEERRRSNYLLAAILALLVACTYLILDKKHSTFSDTKALQKQEDEKKNSTKTKLENFLDEHGTQEDNSKDYEALFPSSNRGKDYLDNNKKIPKIDKESHDGSHIQTEAKKLPVKSTPTTVDESSILKDELSLENFEKESSFLQSSEESLKRLDRLIKWNLPFNPKRDVIFIWHIPMTGSNEIQEIVSICQGLVMANDVGTSNGHENDAALTVFTVSSGAKFMNVNASSKEGLKRAKEMGLGNSKMMEAIMSSYMYETADLFAAGQRTAKCITILRHPIERAIALFYRLQQAAREENHPNSALKDMTIEEYANGPFCEDNWMTRVLTNELEKPLTFNHLELAKEILGRKCLIGIYDHWFESMKRFKKYFGWDDDDTGCDKEPVSNHDPAGGHIWNLFAKKNGLDIALYEYGINLFEKQKMYSVKKSPPQYLL